MAGNSKKRLKRSKVGNNTRCPSGPEENADMKRFHEANEPELSYQQQLLRNIDDLRNRMSALEHKLVGCQLAPVSACQDPSDYGRQLRAMLPPPDSSIVPWPSTPEMADSILPSYETCLGRKVELRIEQANFNKWMEYMNVDQCNFYVSFQGNVIRSGKNTKNVDFSLVKKGKPPTLFYTGAVLALVSRAAKFNGDKELGEAVTRAEGLFAGGRMKVVVGLTNGIQVEWFTLQKVQDSLILQVSPVWSFRESLCGLLLADPSSMYMSNMDIEGTEIDCQLGLGRTSIVYEAKYFGQRVAAKHYRKEFGFALEHEAEILECLKGVQGIPTVVGKDSVQKVLFTTPVGQSLAFRNSVSKCAAIFIELVDILQSVHDRGIVHRDIRPANILVVEGGTHEVPHAVLIDWGFATIAGKEEIFSGAVETGSNRLLEQLLCKSSKGDSSESCLYFSESSFISRPSRRLKKSSLADVKGQSRSPSTITVVGTASGSGGVLTRSRTRSIEMEKSVTKGVICSLNPTDDLVSLVKTLLLLSSTTVKEEVRKIAIDDYQGYLETWRGIMDQRPRWKEAQHFAEVCDYVNLKSFFEDSIKNFLL